MMNEFAEKSYEGLMEALNALAAADGTNVQRLKSRLKKINQTIDELRLEVQQNGFTDDEEEVRFFKYWKPGFVGLYFFEQELFKIELKVPENNRDAIIDYYKQELNFLEMFNVKHQFLREYYLSESDELDPVYFLRQSSAANPLWTDARIHDQIFSTPGDAIFARFRCNDRLKAYLLAALIAIESRKDGPPDLDDYLDLQWTGETVSVVELAYGFWLTGRFNKGKATLSQIVRWIEIYWGVSIDNTQRKFAEISNRKRLSYTRYIDEMKEAIIEKINRGNQ
jgi:hypothetical protein